MKYEGPPPEDEQEERRVSYRRNEDVALHLSGSKFDIRVVGGMLAAAIAFVIWLVQLNFAAVTQAEINGKQEAAIQLLHEQVQKVVQDQVKLATLIDAISQRLAKAEERTDRLHTPKGAM